MKIVVTGTRGIPHIMGGVETHCEELLPRVAKLGHEVTVIRRSWYAKDTLTVWNGVNIVDITAPKKKSFEAIVHTIKAVIKAKKLKADVVHIHAIGPALVAPFARLLGLKVVFTHHGPDYDRDKWGKAAKMMLKLGERFGTKYANEVIVISRVIDQILRDKYGRNDCHLIYNGVPAPTHKDFEDYFNSLGIEKGKYIFAMARFVPEKRLHDLVQAYSLLCKEGKDNGVKLVIAGDADFEDDYSRELKKQAKENNVVLTGFIKGDKLFSLLTGARCFVLPSSHEGLPISLLEAMSYGLPAIISDIPANLEVGLDKSCYYQMGNVEQLREKIEKAVDESYHHVEYDLTKYDWDHIARQVAEVYQMAAGRR